MRGRIIFMTEEESMGKALRELMPAHFPGFLEFQHWLILDHKGKSDLESSFPKKMKAWCEPGVRFIILRDNDGSDCRRLKKNLIAKVPTKPPKYLIRIVCQELESWFIGDLAAVAAAYPAAARQAAFKGLSKADPDELTNASELLKELTGTGAKRARAVEIAKRMQPRKNRSKSFNVFVSGVAQFMNYEN
jgi:hypothetical protein